MLGAHEGGEGAADDLVAILEPGPTEDVAVFGRHDGDVDGGIAEFAEFAGINAEGLSRAQGISGVFCPLCEFMTGAIAELPAQGESTRLAGLVGDEEAKFAGTVVFNIDPSVVPDWAQSIASGVEG